MKIYSLKLKDIILLSLCILCFLFIFCLPTAQAQTAQEYIDTGEDQLFGMTFDGIQAAYSTFQDAHTAHADDAVINTYLAVTRLLNLLITEDPGGLQPLLEEYGFSFEGTSPDTFGINFPDKIDGNTVLPETAPSGEAVRSFFEDSFVATLDESIVNLDTAVNNWTITDKHIIDGEKLNTSADIEFDYGDLRLLRAWFKAVKCVFSIIAAYDLDVSVREAVALSNVGIFNINDFLDRYAYFLTLMPPSDTSDGGAAILAEAESAFKGMVDDYLAASDHIRNDPGTEPGAEEIIELDICEYQGEEFFRTILTDAKDSLINNTDFEIVSDSESWLFTDVATQKEIEVSLWENKSEGEFNGWMSDCQFIGCYGTIDCVTINGDTIEIEMNSLQGYATFTGTLNNEGDGISGDYTGSYGGSPISGTFTASRTSIEQDTVTFNLNPLFGNGSEPNDLRDFLPQFNDYDDPIYGTAGHGLGDDATLGGMLPDMTQDDWEFEAGTCGEIDIPVVENNSILLDGSMADWAEIPVTGTDLTEDSYYGEGTDIVDLYLAKDDNFLYVAITLGNGPPDQSFTYNFGASSSYFDYSSEWLFAFYNEGAGWSSGFIDFTLPPEQRTTTFSGYAAAGGNFIEYKIPLDTAGSMSGKYVQYLSTSDLWVVDENMTCTRISPVVETEISGSLSIPGHNEQGAVYIGAFYYEGSYDPDDRDPLSYQVIYPEEYNAGMDYLLTGIPVDEDIFLIAWWDPDFNGVFTQGDHTLTVPVFTTLLTGNTYDISDQDSDGILDSVEDAGCTEPDNDDSDGDGVPDGLEDANRNGSLDSGETNPCKADTDGDGLTDGEEDENLNGQLDISETDPLDPDTDDDGMPDGWEVTYGLNPLENDADGDADKDNFSNITEFEEGTIPNDAGSHPPRGMPWLPILLEGD